jgi:hypothetical protein
MSEEIEQPKSVLQEHLYTEPRLSEAGHQMFAGYHARLLAAWKQRMLFSKQPEAYVKTGWKRL